MYTRDSSLLVGLATLDNLNAWASAIAAAHPDVNDLAMGQTIVGEYSEAGAAAGLDVNLALAQACQESAWFSSVAWRDRYNPAGIGITGDAVAGPDFKSVRAGVRAHIALLCCYALGSDPEAVTAWNALQPFGFGGFHRANPVLSSLEGAWAVPGDGYAAAIAGIANQVIGGTVEPPAGSATITPDMLVAAAMAHLGDVREFDTWNGEHDVSMMCQADVEDWYTEAGLSIAHYGSARMAADAGPLSGGEPMIGAQIFMRGPGWSVNDHTGVYIGGGRIISGLASVIVSTGWLDLPTFHGWRMPAGVLLTPPVRTAAGNPYGAVAMLHPFSSRWFQLDGIGLALPQMGWPKEAEEALPSGRRLQHFERGWYGTQDAPAPWDLVALLPGEIPAGK